jgi:hypothetical protein
MLRVRATCVVGETRYTSLANPSCAKITHSIGINYPCRRSLLFAAARSSAAKLPMSNGLRRTRMLFAASRSVGARAAR